MGGLANGQNGVQALKGCRRWELGNGAVCALPLLSLTPTHLQIFRYPELALPLSLVASGKVPHLPSRSFLCKMGIVYCSPSQGTQDRSQHRRGVSWATSPESAGTGGGDV